jgi:hypothetical protein
VHPPEVAMTIAVFTLLVLTAAVVVEIGWLCRC